MSRPVPAGTSPYSLFGMRIFIERAQSQKSRSVRLHVVGGLRVTDVALPNAIQTNDRGQWFAAMHFAHMKVNCGVLTWPETKTTPLFPIGNVQSNGPLTDSLEYFGVVGRIIDVSPAIFPPLARAAGSSSEAEGAVRLARCGRE